MRALLSSLRGAAFLMFGGFVSGAAMAAETFCVDGTKEWSLAEHLNGTSWQEKSTAQLVSFLWKDTEILQWWPPGTELGLVWPPVPDSPKELPEETNEKLKQLQAIKVDFKEATKDETATVSFDRTMVKLTDAGAYRDDLTQRWRYVLTFAEDCQSMSGEVTMFKYKQNDASMKGRTMLLRAE